MIGKIVTFILLCNLVVTTVHSDWTITTPATISAINTPQNNTSCSFDPTTGNFLAVWKDLSGTNELAYSFYIPGTGWTASAAISESTVVQHDVFSACDTSTGVILATWADTNNNNYPSYSIYTPGSGWSTPNTITTSSVVDSGEFDVFVSFNPVTGQFLAIWSDSSTYATYAFYTPGTGWGTAGIISGTSRVEGNIFSTANSITGTSMAAWSDLNTNYPTYSIYTPGTGWSTSARITTSAYMFQDVYLSFDSTTGQTLATWGDSQNNSVPTYSFYTPGNGWSLIAAISGTTQVDIDVITSFDPVNGQFLAVWADSSNTNQINYSTYTPGSGWSSPVFLPASPNAEARNNVYLSYDSVTGQILATWTGADDEGRFPYYSFFDGPVPLPPVPEAPASFSGKVMNKRFLSQTDRINQLNWLPANDSTIVSYLLRRNGVLIFTAPSTGPYTYQDHNRNKRVTDVYTLTSVNQKGLESSVLTVTID